MLLSEFLGYFDFEYQVVNGRVRLINLQDAYLGGINQDRFCITSEDKAQLVERLDVYINDYIFKDMEARLSSVGAKNCSNMNLSKLVQKMEEYKLSYDKDVINSILNPETLEFDKDKIIDSFSVGQIYFEKDTEKYIVLENICKDTDDIWNFKVYDTNMKYLYDTTIIDVRLASDIINGYIKSVTHENVLRVETGCVNRVNDDILAVLEQNDFSLTRFSPQIENEIGDLTSIVAKYNKKSDKMVFNLHFIDTDDNTLKSSGHNVVIPAENDEKIRILKELNFMYPHLFAPIEQLIDTSESRYDGLFNKSLEEIEEDIFFRPDNFKCENWYNELQTYLAIGVCSPDKEDALNLQKALKTLGHTTKIKGFNDSFYIVPEAGSEKITEKENPISKPSLDEHIAAANTKIVPTITNANNNNLKKEENVL